MSTGLSTLSVDKLLLHQPYSLLPFIYIDILTFNLNQRLSFHLLYLSNILYKASTMTNLLHRMPISSRITRRLFSSSSSRYSDYSHLVIGGGVVGTAIAARLAKTNANKSASSSGSVLLVERHHRLCTETSARNSGVIHAGLYYPPESLRASLCIKGKNMIYDLHEKGIPIDLQKCGKWVVGQDDKQAEFLEDLYKRGTSLGIPLEWVPLDKAREIEPAVKADAAIINSSSTGIIDPHSVVEYSESELQKYGGDMALLTRVTGIEKTPSGTYKVTMKSRNEEHDTEEEEVTLEVDCVVNAAGHGAAEISNMLLPAERHLTAYYAKGNYFLYTSSFPKVKRLIYPCPSDFGSLGTHLTIDLGGQIKFGPDFEWVDSPDDLAPNAANLPLAIQAISQYMRGLDNTKLIPDYSGMRPKIRGDKEFQDFVIREEEQFPGFVNLLNIESPGLTSSLAIAEYVDDIYNGKI